MILVKNRYCIHFYHGCWPAIATIKLISLNHDLIWFLHYFSLLFYIIILFIYYYHCYYNYLCLKMFVLLMNFDSWQDDDDDDSFDHSSIDLSIHFPSIYLIFSLLIWNFIINRIWNESILSSFSLWLYYLLWSLSFFASSSSASSTYFHQHWSNNFQLLLIL